MEYDESQFRDIYRRCAPAITGFFLKRGCRREEAEDFTSETFSKAYENLDRLNDPDKVKAWLFTIARNVRLGHQRNEDRLKRKGETVPIDVDDIQTTHTDPEQAALLREHAEQAQRCLSDLPRGMKGAFVGRLQGLEDAAIGLRMKINPKTVRSQISQARARLKECLRKAGYHD